ncbi:HupE/UreJ family protein [Woeseia oceani]|uniref:HupE / UreJ protein n=1 Tax=Woeseia oceani TaxID=1548547 RepID=A0A193LLU5_9GAMM|nr:HupE/UreJ family protein [Woeseia oceani]ANO53359.1 hypothetical protein BA177_17525 [Woeseia oceani]
MIFTRRTRQYRLLSCLVSLLLPSLACAQAGNASVLELTVDQHRIAGELSVELDNLNSPLELDTDLDGEVTWDEIRNRRPDIEDHLRNHVFIFANGSEVDLQFDELAYGSFNGMPSILSHFSATAAQDVQHIGINNTLRGDSYRLRLRFAGAASLDTVLPAGGGTASFSRAEAERSELGRSIVNGMLHIWQGYDHILFLLVLLIPAVFHRTDAGRESVSNFGRLLKQVVIVVSAFTITHSLTLSLAAMKLVSLPPRFVEIAIAVSVLLAALHNFLPRTTGVRNAWLASGFGLLHGFGFANFLGESIAGAAPIVRTLVGFNIGVELGQLAIVAVFLPFAFWLRDTRFYRFGLLYGGSGAVCIVSLFWIWGRAF